MAKKFQTATKEINGVKYTAQFNGVLEALRAADQNYIDGTEIVSNEKLADYILNNVIVEPKGLKIDDFKSVRELRQVINFGADVMNGNFQDEEVEESTKKSSK